MGSLIVPAAVIAAQATPSRRPPKPATEPAVARGQARRRCAGTGRFLAGPTPASTALSGQQLEILALIAAGYSRRQVSYKVGLPSGAISVQLARARRKLDAATTAEAVDVARRRGLLPPVAGRAA